ncbi:MAG: co-chaperone GroES [Luteibaculum sp.]
MEVEESGLDNIIVVGDRVLIKPLKPVDKTGSGIFLPPGVQQKEQVYRGYVMRVGPGYAIPAVNEDEPWKDRQENVRYVPLQPQPGDLAVYLQKGAYDIEFNREKYIIVPQSAILLLYRDPHLKE